MEIKKAEENENGIKSSTIVIGFVIAILIGMSIASIHSHFAENKKTWEIHSMQKQALSIQEKKERLKSNEYKEEDIISLNKEIEIFNQKMEKILNFRELYPQNEDIPKKISYCKIYEKKKEGLWKKDNALNYRAD